MQLEELKTQILLKCLSGSRAYGLETASSDTDIRGIFILPQEKLYGFQYFPQIHNETHDIVFYEIQRFFELLCKNNPTILELIFTPEDCILEHHPLMNLIQPEDYLSKLCKDTFAGYALAQIRKARGLNKKINQPQAIERKTVLDCCYIACHEGSLSLGDWLGQRQWQQENCALVKIPHMTHLYALYYDEDKGLNYKGIVQDVRTANDISLSTVPYDALPVAYLSFNRDLYKKHCREYKQYWNWVQNRNENRYQESISHGKNYDSKNMMHTFRLLDMAEEIAQEKTIHLKRPNRDFLLAIRQGEYAYSELVDKAEAQLNRIQLLFEKSDLPEKPDLEKTEALLIKIRTRFYQNAGIEEGGVNGRS